MWPFGSTKTVDAVEEKPEQSQIVQSHVNPYAVAQTAASIPPEASNHEQDSAFSTDPIFQNVVRQRHRLGIDTTLRIPLVCGVGFVPGFLIGAAHGATVAGLRYRAENAHHTPTSKAGWYLYGKSKNYHAISQGMIEGVKNGSKYAAWTALFLGIEDGLDRARARLFARRGEEERNGQRDFLNTLSAAIAFSGIYGWKNGLDRFSAARLTKTAVKLAIPFGLLQDLLASLRDDRPWYVDRVMRWTTERKQQKQII